MSIIDFYTCRNYVEMSFSTYLKKYVKIVIVQKLKDKGHF